MGSKKTETRQENAPPKWAAPLFKQGAKEAQRLYDTKTGYNTYTGPTQAALSAPTLSGLNNALAATGFTGAPITNESINANIPDVMAIMQEALANKQPPQAATSRLSDAVLVSNARPGRGEVWIQRPINPSTGEYMTDDEARAQYGQQRARQAALNRGR
ncbi:hypothetical protein ACFOLL_04380 [Falsochrobactrum ovis]|uniref:Uncharacterized protein n=1 Tax=Falsochrobactrum ovis TaxID=1293442 RepID=A0A364JVK8_9HYPH|nr:hypothetical protein [Falsochrobactrum ovis]RAK29152.1 hypothetical protein C7374_105203 [Falsochrobactrum ovis]